MVASAISTKEDTTMVGSYTGETPMNRSSNGHMAYSGQ